MVLPTLMMVVAVAIEVAAKILDAIANKVYEPDPSLASILKLYLIVYCQRMLLY